MTLLQAEVPLSASSDLTRAKELVRYLEDKNRRLIVDDYHLAAPGSFAPLLDAASRKQPPARVVVISRGYVDLPLSVSPGARLPVGGLGPGQIREMLRRRGVSNPPQRWVRALEEKVEGLPIAVTLFAAAVAEFGGDADDLLAGTFVRNERLKRWFDDVVASLTPEARELLRILSAAAGPFGRPIVRMASDRLGIESAYESFEALQKAHLVENLARFRWSVHQLIATFCQLELGDAGLRRINGYFADHYLKSGAEWPRQMLDEKTFADRVIAWRYLYLADRHQEAQVLLARIAPTAKARGHYETFMRLCEPALRVPMHDPWLDYHYAHACAVVGRLTAAAETLLRTDEEHGDSALSLSLARLHAEVLLAAGDSAGALAVVRRGLADYDHARGGPFWSQAVGVEARIHLALGDIDAVARVASDLLARAQQASDELGAAVAFAYFGYADLANRDFNGAGHHLHESVNRFRREGHRRGLSWALSGLAQTMIAAGNARGALPRVAEALRIRSDVAESSPEYLAFLRQLDAHPMLHTSVLVQDELQRVRSVLDQERTLWERHARHRGRLLPAEARPPPRP
jgi:tetratricopeptide (TPR) repeat protein